MAIDAKVSDKRFQLGGVSYFRSHAEAVQLGDAGVKKTPGTQETYLAVQDSMPRHQLTIERATQIDLHSVVAITPGTTFACLLLTPKWDAKLQKRWKRIDHCADDPWGLQ